MANFHAGTWTIHLETNGSKPYSLMGIFYGGHRIIKECVGSMYLPLQESIFLLIPYPFKVRHSSSEITVVTGQGALSRAQPSSP
ncbi:hypothetical protein AMTR_s00036p00137650 [Amborella trichopoda]|uniref:Uncharacterized protein n=1 Tax=Amborella trichopoda TaxID=13333 RepID=U5CYU2_AMBTC|nr:hypothetical protein AMTR_s00036p00137650 [Amborella trichopoda]